MMVSAIILIIEGDCVKDIIDLDYTIVKDMFSDIDYVWEIFPKIKDYVLVLGESLDRTHYTKISDNVWIGSNVSISDKATIIGPCIIDDNTEIRPGSYIRGNVIIGKNVVIGNSCEIKNSIIFDYAQIPHFNYVGDSILGYKAHLGAGVIISNLKNDKSNVVVKDGAGIDTGLRKFGAVIGNNVDVGCNSVICPGTVIGCNTSIYPLVRVRGVIGNNKIVKDENIIIEKRDM